MFKKQLLILFIVFWSQQSLCFLDLFKEIFKEVWKYVRYLNEAKSTYDTADSFISIFIHAKNHDEALIESLEIIKDKLNDLQAYTRKNHNYIKLLIEQLPDEIQINFKKDKIASFVVITNGLWDKFIGYTKYNCNKIMIEDLAMQILDKIEIDLWLFRDTLTLSSDTKDLLDGGLFISIIKNADKKRDILCNQGETSHHSVMRLFHIAIETEMKAYILLSFAQLSRWSSYEGWTIPQEEKFVEQFNRSIHVLSHALTIARLPYIRSCEPNVWRRDENFCELEGFLQQTVYVTPTACMQPNYPFVRMNNCKALSRGERQILNDLTVLPRSFDDECIMRPINEHNRCSRIPANCTALNGDFEKTIVRPWNEGPYRIRCINHDDIIYGTETTNSCSPGDDGYVGHDSFGVACGCQCFESRVKVMLRMMSSDINNNYVIVGLRIVRLKDYIYIQIAEGKLEANGYIADFSWVNSTRGLFTKGGRNRPPQSPMYKYQSNFYLEDVQLEPGQVLTGIQFAQEDGVGSGGFSIFIWGVEFEYKTGKLCSFLDPGYQLWRDHKPTHELKIPGKSPIKMKTFERAHPNSDGYTHVILRQSDISHDYGQSALPLFDSVPIKTDPLSPIGGVGLFHKGYLGYAGFLSLRLFPINYTYHLETFKESNDLHSLLHSESEPVRKSKDIKDIACKKTLGKYYFEPEV